MNNAKANINVRIDANIKEYRLPFQPSAIPTLEERIAEAALRRNPKRVSLPVDENGNVIIDKEKHPDIYEWAVNG